MAKYLGYANTIAFGQDAEGVPSQTYAIGDDVPDSELSSASGQWYVNNGYQFDPMPGAPAPEQPAPGQLPAPEAE